MNNPAQDEEAVLLFAAEWRARKDAGLTAEEERELVQWLEADPRHEDCFHQMGSTWDLLDVAADATPERLGLSAETRALVEGRGKRRFPTWGVGLAAAAAVAFGWIGWNAWTRAGDLNFQQVAVAEAGYTKRMDLPDGSVIRMNADSEVEVAYAARERSVRLLRGEAHFEVAKDKARPFVVAARGAAVQAVGTAFNVALRADTVEVLVTEGTVSVAAPVEPNAEGQPEVQPEAPSYLIAGEKLVLPLQAEAVPVVATVAPAAVAQELAWREKRLEFDSSPLSEIVRDFNRYNVHQIVIAPEAADLGEQRFAGSFRADDPETFIKLIRLRADVIVERNGQQTVLRRAR